MGKRQEVVMSRTQTRESWSTRCLRLAVILHVYARVRAPTTRPWPISAPPTGRNANIHVRKKIDTSAACSNAAAHNSCSAVQKTKTSA